FKVSLLLVGDGKLCHSFLLRKFVSLIVTQGFSHFQDHRHKTVIAKYFCQPALTMATNPSNIGLFQGKPDRFEGITVFSDLEPCNVEDFPDKLKNSLNTWRTDKKRGVWFKVHLDQCEWVPILIKNGFKYHHAKEDYVMLYIWLPTNESDNVPNYAHTLVGVGAVVVNDADQVLVVKEKYFYKVPMWKLPGGYVEPGENLVDAAIREVLEETNIQTEFESVLTFRQGQSGMFGCSDLYFVVNLKALSQDIQKCTREIADCQWMDIKEYLNHPQVHELNRFFVSKLMHHRKHNLKIDCHHGLHQLLQKPFTVYSVFKTDDVDDSDKIPFTFISGASSKSS
ncbi:hypothetical protein YQE_07034, partial [Dendroctonus ponderosae]